MVVDSQVTMIDIENNFLKNKLKDSIENNLTC